MTTTVVNVSDPNRPKFHEYIGSVKAKRRGHEIKCRPDWDEKRIGIMSVIVYCKFTQNAGPMRVLVSTGSALLIEGNWWKDDFWGMVKNDKGVWVGQNLLGKILMTIRSMFQTTTVLGGDITLR